MFPNKRSEQNRCESNWRIRNNEGNTPQSRYLSSSRFAETRLENVSWRTRSSQASSHSLQPSSSSSGEEHCKRDLSPAHFRFWIMKDANELIQQVMDRKRDYQEYIEKELRDDRIVFVIKMFAKLCVSSESYSVEILNLITNEKLILNLELFLMKLTLQTVENRTFYHTFWADIEDFFHNMCDLLDAIIKSSATKACQILPRMFQTLKFCLPIFETGNNIKVSNHVTVKIAKLIEELEFHESELEEDVKKKVVSNKMSLEENPELSTSTCSSLSSTTIEGNGVAEQKWRRNITIGQLLKWTARDANKLIQEVKDREKYYEECIEKGMENNKIVLVIKIFGKLCVASKTYQVEILNLITNEKLILNIQIFLKQLTLATGGLRAICSSFWADPEEFFNNLCEVLNAIIKNAPTKACLILPSLFNTLTLFMPVLETGNNIEVSNQIKIRIAKLIEELEQISQSREGYTDINESLSDAILKEDNKNKIKVGFKLLAHWNLRDDINEVGQEIINVKESFQRYLEQEIIGDAMVIIVNIFAKLTVSSVSHKDIILKMILNEKFLRNIEIFLLKIQLHTGNARKWFNYFWDNTSEFFDNLTNVLNYVIYTLLTREHHKSVLRVFEALERCLPMFEREQNIPLSNDVKVMTVAMHEMLLESNEQNLPDKL